MAKPKNLDAMGWDFDMVEAGKARNEVIIVVAILVFNAEIVGD